MNVHAFLFHAVKKDDDQVLPSFKKAKNYLLNYIPGI